MSNWNFTTENGADDGYDAEDRFLRFDRPTQNEEFTWARSDIGNIGNINLESNLFQSRSYNELHQLESVASVTQVFNADMQMTTTHTGLTPLTWDQSGQLKQVVVPAAATAGLEGTHSYGYDASGRRVWKNKDVTTGTDEHLVFIYSGPNCIAEYHAGDDPSTADPQRQYVYGTAIDELLLIDTGTQKQGVTRNQQWSITALYDNADGAVVERYTYDMFGTRRVLNPDATDTQSPLSTVGNPYGSTSRRHDEETGLMYFRARYNDPTIETGGSSNGRCMLCYCELNGRLDQRYWIETNCRDSDSDAECCKKKCPGSVWRQLRGDNSPKWVGGVDKCPDDRTWTKPTVRPKANKCVKDCDAFEEECKLRALLDYLSPEPNCKRLRLPPLIAACEVGKLIRLGLAHEVCAILAEACRNNGIPIEPE